MGAVTDCGREIVLSAPRGLRPSDVFMDEPSVMATENALMAAALTPGTTVIGNAACEPHVQDLARMLVKMGADIQGIGSNLITVNGAERLRGCEHDVAPDHIEIGSFMALAGVTGGELRIKDTVPGDLRMIRLVFERVGLRSELDGNDVVVPGGQKLVVQADVGEYKSKIQDGPWPAFPADLTSIAVALATQAEGSVLVHEWMFENRLIFTDKLILMGADIVLCDPHRAIVTGPRRLRGERVESPDIRAGMAMLLAALCAEGRSEIGNIRQIDRGYERIDERLRALGARIERVATEPVPRVISRVSHDPADSQRHARRAARRDARAARDHRRPARRVRAPRLRRDVHARARVRVRARARGHGRGAARLPRVRRDRRGAGAALGHDRADRARGRHALRLTASRRCASATSPTATAASGLSAASRASCCRRASS